MKCNEIFIENLKLHYNAVSCRLLAKSIGYSISVILNWSSGRSSPSLEQIDLIAYNLNVDASELLKPSSILENETPFWKENIKNTFYENLGKFRLEKNVCEENFNNLFDNEIRISYRSFIRYVNKKNKRVNLYIIHQLALILSIKPYELLMKG